MIDVMVTMRVNDEPLTMFGKVDDKNNTIIMNYQIHSRTIEELDLLHHRPFDIPLIDTSAKQYSAYGCRFLKKTLSLGTNTVQVEGTFHRLLKERKLGSEYDAVRFSFVGIEEFFPLERFVTQYEVDGQSLSFTKEKSNVLEYKIQDGILCKVESTFVGAKSSSQLYDLDVKQEKSIRFFFPTKMNVDEHFQFVIRVKQYFEFIVGQEIQLCDVSVFNQNNPFIDEAEVICEPLFLPHTYIKTMRDRPYRGSIDNLFAGLNGWLTNYDTHQRVLGIWEKTIYNLSVSEEDLFIWRCQAFELLCTLNTEIFHKADSLKAKKQQYPNLKNFLTAIKSLYGILSIQSEYYKDVKDVRDVLTHNNPSKSVSDNQKKNAFEIMKAALTKTIAQVFGIEGIPTSICLGKAGI